MVLFYSFVFDEILNISPLSNSAFLEEEEQEINIRFDLKTAKNFKIFICILYLLGLFPKSVIKLFRTLCFNTKHYINVDR